MAGRDENLLSGDFGGSRSRLLRKARNSRKEGIFFIKKNRSTVLATAVSLQFFRQIHQNILKYRAIFGYKSWVPFHTRHH
jgi:hypothetical protein